MCFTCKGYREVECLVREVTGLRQMLECTRKTITGQGLEEKRGETGNRMAGFEEAEENEKSEGLKRVMTPDQHFDRTDPDRKGSPGNGSIEPKFEEDASQWDGAAAV